MSESENEILDGFAGLMYNQFVRPLKDSEEFKEKYKDTDTKIFLNITDATNSAVLILKNGTIDVEAISREDQSGLEKAKKECKAKIETDMRTFASMDDISMLKAFGKILTRKMKVKGIGKVMMLQDLRALADAEDAKYYS